MKKYRVINELNDRIAYVSSSDNGEIQSNDYERVIKEVGLKSHHPNVLRIEQDIDSEFKLYPIIGKSKKKRVIVKYKIAPVSRNKRDIDYQHQVSEKIKETVINDSKILTNDGIPEEIVQESQAVNPIIKRGPGRPPKRIKIYAT